MFHLKQLLKQEHEQWEEGVDNYSFYEKETNVLEPCWGEIIVRPIEQESKVKILEVGIDQEQNETKSKEHGEEDCI